MHLRLSNLYHRSNQRVDDRRGTTLVETAFVLPVFMFFVLGLVEVGNALMVQNVLRSATRAGARLGATDGKSTSDVTSYVNQVIGGAIDAQNATVSVKNAEVYDTGSTPPETSTELEALPSLELTDAEPRQLFMVRAKVNYNSVALVPMPFMEAVVLEAQSFIRHE